MCVWYWVGLDDLFGLWWYIELIVLCLGRCEICYGLEFLSMFFIGLRCWRCGCGGSVFWICCVNLIESGIWVLFDCVVLSWVRRILVLLWIVEGYYYVCWWWLFVDFDCWLLVWFYGCCELRWYVMFCDWWRFVV